MNKYYQNTFLFISKHQSVLQPLLKSLQWAFRQQIERLDVSLIRMGMLANMLSDSRKHSILDYDLYQHNQTKEYILRIHTESEGDTHPIDMEYCRVYLSPILNYITYQKDTLNVPILIRIYHMYTCLFDSRLNYTLMKPMILTIFLT